MTSHPARFSPEIIDTLRTVLEPGSHLHDPFAGTGERLGALADELDCTFSGTEIESAFTIDPRVRRGNSIQARTYPDPPYVIVTSPVYPNGMADHFKASDGSRRHTYRQGLAEILGYDQPLNIDNMGRYSIRKGKTAEQTYWAIARAVVAQWNCETAIVNVKDCVAGGTVYPVVDRWDDLLGDAGFVFGMVIDVPCPGQRHGANRDLRVDHESILIRSKAST